ncbi:MAG: MoaD/ThiS family protein [Leptospirales bacterium]
MTTNYDPESTSSNMEISESRPISLNLVYFGVFREKSGLSEETIWTYSRTPRDLYQELEGKYLFDFPLSHLRVAVDGKVADLDAHLDSGNIVVYLPPFGGG